MILHPDESAESDNHEQCDQPDIFFELFETKQLGHI